MSQNLSKEMVSNFVFGLIAVLYGISIYYLLPYSLLSQNLGMILGIFFAILLGMFTGLTLLATNVLGSLETFLIYTLFFWEKKSMRTLLRKNLSLHRDKNFLTSLIYALTLGCVIFLLVGASLQVQTMAATSPATAYDLFDETAPIFASDTDPVLLKYANKIESFGYISKPID